MLYKLSISQFERYFSLFLLINEISKIIFCKMVNIIDNYDLFEIYKDTGNFVINLPEDFNLSERLLNTGTSTEDLCCLLSNFFLGFEISIAPNNKQIVLKKAP